MKPETREKLRAALKAKWASGTRKKNPPETYIKSSATMRRLYAEGKVKIPDKATRIRVARIAGLTKSEKKTAQVTALGKAKKGVPNIGRGAATEDNWKAKVWCIRSPRGIIYRFVNLSLWARRNAHLFEDKRPYAKAPQWERVAKGISTILEASGRVCHYQGWTAVSKIEKALGGGDLLGRDEARQ